MRTYFLLNEITGHIKIGRSKDPESRCKNIQNSGAGRFVLLGSVDGDFEKRWHKEFATERLYGEWFKGTNRLIEAIRDLGIDLGLKSVDPETNPNGIKRKLDRIWWLPLARLILGCEICGAPTAPKSWLCARHQADALLMKRLDSEARSRI